MEASDYLHASAVFPEDRAVRLVRICDVEVWVEVIMIWK